MKKWGLAMAALCAAVFIFGTFSHAADSGFPIYFESSKLIVKPETVNKITYLPLVDILQYMKLPYTDATSLETLTVRNGNSRLVLTKNSELISINDQIMLLHSPVLHDNNRWLVPVDFLSVGLSRITATEFRTRAGSQRVFAGSVQAPALEMNVQSLGSITRLTIRLGSPSNVTLNRSDPRHTLILIARTPLDPVRETIEHSDRLVGSVAYDDADGEAKIVADTSEEVSDVHVAAAEGNEIFFVDFSGRPATTAADAPPPDPATAPRPDAVAPLLQSKLRVVVLDPGHGGLDIGTTAPGLQEKDLTMILARKLRAALQARLGVTVLLTRDSDVELDNAARSAVANNNQANLFISLHIGNSPNKMDSGSSVFVMKDNFGGTAEQNGGREPLFLPWYMGYRISEPSSTQAATLLQEELTKALPGWKFPLRQAPLGVLSSTTMPAVVLEIGNINNTLNAQTLVDANFQNKLVATLAGAVQRFAETQPAK